MAMIVEFTTSGNKPISIETEQIESITDLRNYSNRPGQTSIRTKSGNTVILMDWYNDVIKSMGDQSL